MPFDKLSQMMNVGLDPTGGQYLDPEQDPNVPQQSLSDKLTQALSSSSPTPNQSDPRSSLQDLANNTSGTQQLADAGSPDIMQQVKDYISQNLDKQSQNTQDMNASLIDRIKMASNPNMQGPPQPGAFDKQTPQTDAYLNNLQNIANIQGIAARAPIGAAQRVEKIAQSYENMPSVTQWSREKLEGLKDMLSKIQERPSISAEDKAMASQRFSSALKRAATQGVDTTGLLE